MINITSITNMRREKAIKKEASSKAEGAAEKKRGDLRGCIDPPCRSNAFLDRAPKASLGPERRQRLSRSTSIGRRQMVRRARILVFRTTHLQWEPCTFRKNLLLIEDELRVQADRMVQGGNL